MQHERNNEPILDMIQNPRMTDRVEAARLDLSRGLVAALAQGQEPESARRHARGRRRLGPLRLSSLRNLAPVGMLSGASMHRTRNTAPNSRRIVRSLPGFLMTGHLRTDYHLPPSLVS